MEPADIQARLVDGLNLLEASLDDGAQVHKFSFFLASATETCEFSLPIPSSENHAVASFPLIRATSLMDL